MRRSRGLARSGVAAALLTAMLALGAPQAAALTAEEAGAKIASDYGVEVLRVRADTIEDTEVWLVTVMKPGGDSNDAFQVTTLAVDRATGELVPAFRHGASGAAGTGGAFSTQIERRPEVLRSGEVWR